MQPHAPVRCRDQFARSCSPGLDDPIDRSRIELRAVTEDDDRRLDLVAERGQPTAQRCSRATRPLWTVNGSRARLDLVRAEHDDDLAERGAATDPFEHGLEQDGLLGRAIARRRARGEHHRRDQEVVTSIRNTTTFRVGRPVVRLPSLPTRSTTRKPFVTTPRIAYSGGSLASAAVTTKN